MSEQNKAIVEKVNMAFEKGDAEGFLDCCADDVVWTMAGDKTTEGKDEMRKWMSAMKDMEPPKINAEEMIVEGDVIACLGTMAMKDKDGTQGDYSFCDVYHFRHGKIASGRSFVIKQKTEDGSLAVARS